MTFAEFETKLANFLPGLKTKIQPDRRLRASPSLLT
jgi:hypothetical protein